LGGGGGRYSETKQKIFFKWSEEREKGERKREKFYRKEGEYCRTLLIFIYFFAWFGFQNSLVFLLFKLSYFVYPLNLFFLWKIFKNFKLSIGNTLLFLE